MTNYDLSNIPTKVIIKELNKRLNDYNEEIKQKENHRNQIIMESKLLQSNNDTIKENPILKTTTIWLKIQKNVGKGVTTKQLFNELSIIAKTNNIDLFPNNTISLGKQLFSLKSRVKNIITISKGKVNGRTSLWVIRPTIEQPQEIVV
ncbi:MAG: hypothetical protein GY756_17315 [bacterium]|nr:hypothetical protein [bacterium]